MASSMHLYQYLDFGRRLDERQISGVCGALAHNLPLDKNVPPECFARLVPESAIRRMLVPLAPTVKMARREHVDAFFRDGIIRLGTFAYYNQFDHEEIGDPGEGSFILAGQSPTRTVVAHLAGGFNQYVLCCYSGEPDDACVRRFGYDDSFVINEPARFAESIANALGAEGFEYAACAYGPHKVMVGAVPEDFNFQIVSHRLLDLTTSAKYYIKPETYSHQREFRFLWQMPGDVKLPIDIYCPAAIEYCTRGQ